MPSGLGILPFFEHIITQRGLDKFIRGLTLTKEERLYSPWEVTYDEDTDIVTYMDFDDEKDTATRRRFTIGGALEERLLQETAKAISQFKTELRSCREVEAMEAFGRLYGECIKELRDQLESYENAQRYDNQIRKSLDELETGIRKVLIAVRDKEPFTEATKTKQSTGKSSSKRGNPNFKPRLSQKEQQELVKDYHAILEEDPDYASRRGRISDAIKVRLAQKYNVSEATVYRVIRKSLQDSQN